MQQKRTKSFDFFKYDFHAMQEIRLYSRTCLWPVPLLLILLSKCLLVSKYVGGEDWRYRSVAGSDGTTLTGQKKCLRQNQLRSVCLDRISATRAICHLYVERSVKLEYPL
jgi:hypothetical protein